MPDTNPQDYVYWRAALAGERPAVHERDPQCGYYALPIRNGRNATGSNRWPVAVWRAAPNEIVGLRGYEIAAMPIDPADTWLEFAAHPITEATYEAAFKAGRFPDDLPAEALARPRAPTSDGEARPNAVAPEEAMSDQIDAATKSAEGVAVESDEDLGKAQSLRARLNELASSADKMRDVEKRPHLEAGRVVDAKWQPLIKKAKDAANTVASIASRYLNERDRKAREATAAAQRAASEAARAAEAANVPPPPPVTPPPQPAPVTSIKGGYGRGAAVVMVVVAKVVDPAAFLAHLVASGDAPLGDFLRERASQLAKAGVETMPGVEIGTEKRVR